MFADLFANILQALRDPRASARMMMGRQPDFADAGLMVVLAFCVHVISGSLIVFFTTGEATVASIPMRVGELGLQLLSFGLMTVGAHVVGRKFGGTASRRQIAGLVGWHAVATSALSPFQYLGIQAAMTSHLTGLFLLVPVCLGWSIWVFGAFVAEAHRFERTGPVVGATVAGFVALGIVLAIVTTIVTGPQSLASPA